MRSWAPSKGAPGKADSTRAAPWSPAGTGLRPSWRSLSKPTLLSSIFRLGSSGVANKVSATRLTIVLHPTPGVHSAYRTAGVNTVFAGIGEADALGNFQLQGSLDRIFWPH